MIISLGTDHVIAHKIMVLCLISTSAATVWYSCFVFFRHSTCAAIATTAPLVIPRPCHSTSTVPHVHPGFVFFRYSARAAIAATAPLVIPRPCHSTSTVPLVIPCPCHSTSAFPHVQPLQRLPLSQDSYEAGGQQEESCLHKIAPAESGRSALRSGSQATHN